MLRLQLLVQQDLLPEALRSTIEEWGLRREACCMRNTALTCLLHQQCMMQRKSIPEPEA